MQRIVQVHTLLPKQKYRQTKLKIKDLLDSRTKSKKEKKKEFIDILTKGDSTDNDELPSLYDSGSNKESLTNFFESTTWEEMVRLSTKHQYFNRILKKEFLF